VSLAWLLWWQPPCLLRVVVVNLIDDPDSAIQGVLWRSRGPWLSLRKVSILKANSAPLAVDGDVIVHRSNVNFIQVLPE
jgi:hypothetical protein